MFRRRSQRRPLRLLGRIRRGRRAPQELILANQMLESGNYQGAAEQFEAIARAAESRGGRRAPQFYLQAGHAHILARNSGTGLAYMKHGLSLLAKRAEWRRFYNVGNRIVEELKQRGLGTEANQVSEFLKANLPGNISLPSSALPIKKSVLPTHCPSCGGALRPDEIEWLDEITAECAYCGSLVRETD